ncbi:MAG TPA: hypothetical protein V6D03_10860, partial [Candidatus Caenarcaniphilales bacterium]
MGLSLILLCTSFLLSFLTVGVIHQQLRQYLLDVPTPRSSHRYPTPRGGGMGFILAFIITQGIAQLLQSNLAPPGHGQGMMWLILSPLMLVGIIDDQQGVPARVKLLVQLGTSVIAVAYFGFFPQPWLVSLGLIGGVIAAVCTVIGMTAMINFYNFMDGLDGLVAGVAAVQFVFLALWLNQPMLTLIAAALAGFLCWNWSPARIFMGDVGSTALGAILAISLLNNSGEPVQAWSALAITLPLVSDAIYTLV